MWQWHGRASRAEVLRNGAQAGARLIKVESWIGELAELLHLLLAPPAITTSLLPSHSAFSIQRTLQAGYLTFQLSAY